MRYNRKRIDIASHILETANCRNGATKSLMMSSVYLTLAQLKQYLIALTENNLLDCDIDTQKFKTTKKGLKFLNDYNQMATAVKKSATELMSEGKAQQQQQYCQPIATG